MSIYLDNNATTFLCLEAREALLEYCSIPLNPQSTHRLGRKAYQLLQGATEAFANFFGCHCQDIVFTSGATEALNLYFGHIQQTQSPAHVLTNACEHHAVLNPLKRMACAGWTIDYAPINSNGHINLEDLEKILAENKIGLLAFMLVNNETGVIHPIEEIARMAQNHRIPFIVDAVAAAGKFPLTMYNGITAMVISAHKFHGPAGVGVLAYRSSILLPAILGGGQQLGRRSGLLNIACIIAAQAAMEAYMNHQTSIHHHLQMLQHYFEKSLAQVNAIANGSLRASHVSNLYFPKVDAETLLIQLDQHGLAASHGSACQAGSLEPSHVLVAMHSVERARASLRFSFARTNTLLEIENACQTITEAVRFQLALADF